LIARQGIYPEGVFINDLHEPWPAEQDRTPGQAPVVSGTEDNKRLTLNEIDKVMGDNRKDLAAHACCSFYCAGLCLHFYLT
jgi:hypothetical protein